MKKEVGSTYKNLIQQADKITRHNRQGSKQTRHRYEQSFKRFCAELSKTKVTNIRNIKPSHVKRYVESMMEDDLSPAYIMVELSAIRFYHDKIDRPRCRELPTNEELGLDSRSYSGINRKWSDTEISKFKDICYNHDREDIAAAVDIGRYAGFRIHEVTKLTKDDLRLTLENDYFTIKGKGGRIREVPLQDELRPVIEDLYNNSDDGRIFVSEGEKTHNVIHDIQGFIRENRSIFQDKDRKENQPDLTFHGLRHRYAYEEYEKAINDGYSKLEAEYKVSNLLGHSRPEITRRYLGK